MAASKRMEKKTPTTTESYNALPLKNTFINEMIELV